MSRFVLSFCIALAGHFYLLQYHFNLSELPPSQVISDNSVRVTLDQNIGKAKSQSFQNLPQKEQKPKQQKRKEKKDIVPLTPKVLPEVIPPPKKRIQTENQQIKVQKKKISKTAAKLPQPEQKNAPTEIAREQVLEENSETPAVSSQADKSEEAEVSHQNRSTLAAVAPTAVTASPLYQHNPIPEYPSIAKRRRWEGIVTLLVEVTEGGQVASIRLQKSSGYDILDKTAQQAVKTWRFLAGTIDGKPIRSEVIVPVHFTIH